MRMNSIPFKTKGRGGTTTVGNLQSRAVMSREGSQEGEPKARWVSSGTIPPSPAPI